MNDRDRRGTPRRTPPSPIFCRVTGPSVPAGATAVLLDVSERGLGLFLSHPVPVGAQALLEFVGGLRPFRVRVVHASPAEGGSCLVGARLEDALTPAELRRLLASPPA
jgi:hypothetical protein